MPPLFQWVFFIADVAYNAFDRNYVGPADWENTVIDWVLPVVTLVLLFRARSTLAQIWFGRLNWWGIAALGVAGGIASLALSYASLEIWLRIHDNGDIWHGLVQRGGNLRTILLAPFYEEVVFQAVLQTKLQRLGGRAAVIVTTLLFAALHWQIFQTQLLAVIAKVNLSLLVYAVIRQTTKSLGAAIIAHSLNNVIIFFWTY